MTATARMGELCRGGRRTNDRIDATANAAVSQGDARVVHPQATTDILALPRNVELTGGTKPRCAVFESQVVACAPTAAR